MSTMPTIRELREAQGLRVSQTAEKAAISQIAWDAYEGYPVRQPRDDPMLREMTANGLSPRTVQSPALGPPGDLLTMYKLLAFVVK